MNRFDVILRAPNGRRATWDIPIYETASFVAVPSLGSLVPGWMLIIPRRAVLSLRMLGAAERHELNELAARMICDMGVFAGEVFAFEHGSTEIGSVVGCGVDQAHLHLVPLPFDLIAEIKSDDDNALEWSEPTEAHEYFDTVPLSGEYVSIWNPGDHVGLSGIMRVPQSQWVRRVIARKLGNDEAWDYKAHPNHENLKATVDIFKTTLI